MGDNEVGGSGQYSLRKISAVIVTEYDPSGGTKKIF